MADILETLKAFSTAPSSEGGKFANWIKQTEVPEFLIANAQQVDLLLFASFHHVFIKTVLVTVDKLGDGTTAKCLKEWDLAGDAWGLNFSYDETEVWLEEPFANERNGVLRNAEPIIYARNFLGFGEDKNYYELSQKIAHIFDLHYVPHRKAYCRLDQNGDIENVVTIHEIPGVDFGHDGFFITIKRDILDNYLLLTDSVAVRVFDFTRVQNNNFSGWGEGREPTAFESEALAYDLTIQSSVGSYLRGAQIIRSSETMESYHRRLRYGEDEQKYASFIAFDGKNQKVCEVSTAPGATANYFTESTLPFEITPAFFRPEVLSKYKSNPEKYILRERSINCRGAWHLQTYDINEAGQVHTYIVYLRSLPYTEQLYWKAFNEPPKGTISKRAFKTDIVGEFEDKPSALQSLLHSIRGLIEAKVPWWTIRDGNLLTTIHFPVTDSREEWADELLKLDKLIVEGFEERWLRQKAKDIGQDVKDGEGSLALLERCAIGLGEAEDQAKQIVSVFRRLRRLRSKLKGHATGEEAKALQQEALKAHGSYRRHFDDMMISCDASIGKLLALFNGDDAFDAR